MTKNEYLAQQEKLDTFASAKYARLVEEDKGKSYLDILPAEFKTFKRSIIKKDILKNIDRVTNFLNLSPLYTGQKFSKEQVTRYMMIGIKWNNFLLGYKFIPKVYDHLYHNPDYKIASEEVKDEMRKPYDELEYNLSCLRQSWEFYENRMKVKSGNVDSEYDTEDGIPHLGRGNLCSLFTPVKGQWIKDKSGDFELFNPRTKRNIKLKIEQYKNDDDIYVCLDNQGKRVFLTSYESVQDAWSALFEINKEIYSGWWNKVLISNE